MMRNIRFWGAFSFLFVYLLVSYVAGANAAGWMIIGTIYPIVVFWYVLHYTDVVYDAVEAWVE